MTKKKENIPGLAWFLLTNLKLYNRAAIDLEYTIILCRDKDQLVLYYVDFYHTILIILKCTGIT